MKKAEWQAVYAPQGDALERRVRQTLDGLEEKNRYAYPKRGAFIAAALVLALITAAAVAAGLTRSAPEYSTLVHFLLQIAPQKLYLIFHLVLPI